MVWRLSERHADSVEHRWCHGNPDVDVHVSFNAHRAPTVAVRCQVHYCSLFWAVWAVVARETYAIWGIVKRAFAAMPSSPYVCHPLNPFERTPR